LWAPEFNTVAFGPVASQEETKEAANTRLATAGRQFEIFLDRVVALTAQDSVHHLLDRRTTTSSQRMRPTNAQRPSNSRTLPHASAASCPTPRAQLTGSPC
jgi:hypothetical protein